MINLQVLTKTLKIPFNSIQFNVFTFTTSCVRGWLGDIDISGVLVSNITMCVNYCRWGGYWWEWDYITCSDDTSIVECVCDT